MEPRTFTREQSREVDRIAIQRYGFSGLMLMENAGRGVVEVLLELDPELVRDSDCRVTILCGKGNNGGDGFVIARHLEIRGVLSQVILLAPPAELEGDALANFKILQHTTVPIKDHSNKPFTADGLSASADSELWLLDAILGTGASGEPREPYASAIQWMNQQAARRLAIDIPSGLDCDSGTPAAATVRADHTCTFVAAKQGFSQPAAQPFVGQVHVVGIGVPPSLVEEL